MKTVIGLIWSLYFSVVGLMGVSTPLFLIKKCNSPLMGIFGIFVSILFAAILYWLISRFVNKLTKNLKDSKDFVVVAM